MQSNYEEKGMWDMRESERQDHRNGGLIKFLPSLITVAAFCVGLTSVRLALLHKWEYAVFCIFVAALLDTLDGRIARLTGQSSQFGAQFDSLSDLVCFGVAPALILFLRSVYSKGNIGWGVCLFFTVCCALRLARFNADMLTEPSKTESEKKYFKGVPAPAGAMLALFPMLLFFQTSNPVFLNPVFVAVSLVVSGALMISCIRTFSSKMIEVSNGSSAFIMLTSGLFVICLITELWLTLSIFIVFYLFSIPYGIYEYTRSTKGNTQVKKSAATEEPLQNPTTASVKTDAPAAPEGNSRHQRNRGRIK
jgi:CDP-diacylglycerol--serine O-phosphatidyltransferase